MENHHVSHDGMISQEVVPDINLFGSRMLTRIISNIDDTLIVTLERDIVQSITIVL
jgi:hypothetical protein